MPLNYQLERIGDVTVIRLEDSKLVPDSGDELYGLVEEGGHRRLLLNFGKVTFLSSNALGILVNLQKRLKAVGGSVKLCCLDPDLIDLFKLTNLMRLFEIYDHEQEAIEKF